MILEQECLWTFHARASMGNDLVQEGCLGLEIKNYVLGITKKVILHIDFGLCCGIIVSAFIQGLQESAL